ncbi:transcriptional regulator with XRE-family HTH domain [Pseudorhizobium tarimense]|uniref:Transcriptional regulator with XRE-family HTH domain n=1 Tax=Pseudorhizobium tarimense TaxID=1079109 RepID=A0ABV2HE50_9HYPH|nr:helix-turn-helix transcriptional regulator [Pseudorhizobium tarimense]MCJ8521782.1 helix-turn-helix transcriptional regulator [Pseudorhizobium tarimense]
MKTAIGPSNLGTFLKDRRQRLDAAALGFGGRRRTPGLRREEVAQRAHISTTWYTWLEQGRGGAPSPHVLDRLAKALLLTEAEREHLFLVGIGHAPKIRPPTREGISGRLQRLLDAMPMIPATVATSTWDIIGWNRAAQLVLTDYALLPSGERNILRRMFVDPATREAQSDWEAVARFLVATFRAESMRAGEGERATELIAELSGKSTDFVRIWSDNDLQNAGEGAKTICHSMVGKITVEFSTFAIAGRPDLKLMIYNPADAADIEKIRRLHDSARSS